MTLTKPAPRKPGCLAGLLNLLRGRSDAQTELDDAIGIPTELDDAISEPVQAERIETWPYRVRDNFLTPAELSFHHVLRGVVGERAVVLTKVNLGDIFYVQRRWENQGAFARIAQKHVDFVLCAADTMRPMVAIELDDASHQRPDRRERDTLVNRVFKTAALPLLHFPVRQSYQTDDLAAALAPHLGGEVEAGDGTPLCPDCGIPMQRQVARHGHYAGQAFYGCPNYPRCRQIVQIVGEG